MENWKSHIEQGNEHFRNEAYNLAETAYIHACARAEKLFHYWMDAEEIVAASIIAYHNLADCLKCQSRYKEALYALEKIHQLMSIGLSATRQGNDRYEALLKGRNKTYTALQRFIKIMNNADNIAEDVMQRERELKSLDYPLLYSNLKRLTISR